MDICSEMERFGKGIGNATRYTIVQTLLKGPRTVGEIVKIVKMSQPSVSQHLKTLKGCGLITDERNGQEVIYSIDAKQMLMILHILANAVDKAPKIHIKKAHA